MMALRKALHPEERPQGASRRTRGLDPIVDNRPGASLIGRVAELEEQAAAPNSERALAGDPILLGQLDQLVKYRSRDARLQPRAHQDIGRRRAVVSGLDPQLVPR